MAPPLPTYGAGSARRVADPVRYAYPTLLQPPPVNRGTRRPYDAHALGVPPRTSAEIAALFRSCIRMGPVALQGCTRALALLCAAPRHGGERISRSYTLQRCHSAHSVSVHDAACSGSSEPRVEAGRASSGVPVDGCTYDLGVSPAPGRRLLGDAVSMAAETGANRSPWRTREPIRRAAPTVYCRSPQVPGFAPLRPERVGRDRLL